MILRVRAFMALLVAAAFVITPSPVSQGHANSASTRYHVDGVLFSDVAGISRLDAIDRATLMAVQDIGNN
jgi:hypothetical protein